MKKVKNITVLLLLCIVPLRSNELVLMETGEGVKHVVQVEAPELFRIGFEYKWNYGLSQWYNLANDSDASRNLCRRPDYGDTASAFDQGALFNWAIYTPDRNEDWIGYVKRAEYLTSQTLTIIEQSATRIIIETKSQPTWTNTDHPLWQTVRYHIYPDGKIYIKSTLSAVGGDQPVGAWRNAIIGLGDPTHFDDTSMYNSASQGWMACTPTQNPYEWSDDFSEYLFLYWDPATSPPYTENWRLLITAVTIPLNCSDGWMKNSSCGSPDLNRSKPMFSVCCTSTSKESSISPVKDTLV